MKFVLLPLLLFSSLAFAAVEGLTPESFVPASFRYDKGSYAAIDFKYPDFAQLVDVAEKMAGRELITRGEAHLTVLTPQEYQRLGSQMRDLFIQELRNLEWAQDTVEALCIASGSIEIKGRTESTYFVVVSAPQIDRIRRRYGLTTYYPHVTLGFTQRDLHLEDGVVKLCPKH